MLVLHRNLFSTPKMFTNKFNNNLSSTVTFPCTTGCCWPAQLHRSFSCEAPKEQTCPAPCTTFLSGRRKEKKQPNKNASQENDLPAHRPTENKKPLKFALPKRANDVRKGQSKAMVACAKNRTHKTVHGNPKPRVLRLGTREA